MCQDFFLEGYSRSVLDASSLNSEIRERVNQAWRTQPKFWGCFLQS
jgi:hypothetical protein